MFYHFTSEAHLPLILAAGFLRTTESNVGSPTPVWPPFGNHIGPDVLWLLDVPEVRFDHGLSGSVLNKDAVRFTVRADAVRWLNWQPRFDMHPEWHSNLLRAGGGPKAARHWYVTESDVWAEDWIEVKNMRTGEILSVDS